MTIGIERLAVYLPGEAVTVETLTASRSAEAPPLDAAGGRTALAVAAPCEDVVTCAATAGARALRDGDVSPHAIGLLLVASAGGTPGGGPIAGYVQELLGVGPRCRALDVVSGSFGSTAAVAFAHDWVRAGGLRNRCALVIAADVRRRRPDAPSELDQGAAAVAMIVGLAPKVLMLCEDGVPSIARRPVVRSPYRAALTESFTALRDAERPVLEPSEALTDRLARVLYQTRTPAAADAAHRHVLALDWQASRDRWSGTPTEIAAAMDSALTEQVKPWTAVQAQVGSVGAAGIWLALAAIVERDERRLGGRRVGAFGFGAGYGGEFFTGIVPAAVGQVAATGLAEALGGRVLLDGDVYRQRAARASGGDPPDAFAGDFLYVTTRRGRRTYVARDRPTP